MLDLLEGTCGTLLILKYDKGLATKADVGVGDDFEDFAILLKDGFESLFED